MKNRNGGFVGILLVIILGMIALLVVMWGLPYYSVFAKNMAGKAELQKQEWEKLIIIEEAKAQLESASLRADAEIARARGVAEANEIIGGSLKGNSEYLQYLWIDGLKNGNGERIYIPTEAGLPILEARDNK